MIRQVHSSMQPYRPRRPQAPVLRAVPAPTAPPVVLIDVPAAEASPIKRLGLDRDGLFALLLMTPLLFIAQLVTLGAATFAALSLAYLILRRGDIGGILKTSGFLLILPAFAFLSTVWSEAPAATVRASLQLGVTVVAALLLASAPNPRAVMRGLTLSFLAYVVVAVAAGGSVAIGVGAGGEAFSGLTSSKNLLADIASTGALVAAATLAGSLRRKRWAWCAIAAVTFLACLYAVGAARSAGAILGLVIGLAALGALMAVMQAPKALRGFITAASALCLITAGLAHKWLVATVMEVGFRVFDKDPTLTGRTYLWYRANELINERPFLGRGYYAFWQQGNLDAEGLWRYFGIAGRGGFTFHNTLVDVVVALGWVGFVLVALLVAAAAIALVRRFVVRPSLTLVLWISVLVYQLARTPIETIGFAPFYFSTVMMFVALASGFARPARRAASVAAAPSPFLRQVWPHPPETAPLRIRFPGPGHP